MREACSPVANHYEIDSLSSSVVKALLYFDIFNYPLTLDEVKRFLPDEIVTTDTIKQTLNGLIAKGLVSDYHHFYSFEKDFQNVENRLLGNISAEKMMKTAKKFSRFIQTFPYVRCVCISGSLSKGFMDEKSDIDYFIITAPNRLWIARTLLIAFKKIFLLNSSRYFCVNYFIDTDHLEIPDKNIFTATELLTLIPMSNPTLFEAFLDRNKWAMMFLPNITDPFIGNLSIGKAGFFKRLIEGVLERKGDRLDIWFMKLTLNRWKKKFPHLSNGDFELSLRTRRYVSKHHPQNFQNKVLKALEEKQLTFEATHNVKL